jgi:two-component system, NtrC family, nitrogen regulation sensor histidine kinase NtrY
MVSEWLLYVRARIALLVLSIISFVFAGFFLSGEKYFLTVLSFITGLVLVVVLQKIYNLINEATSGFFEALLNEDTSMHFPVRSGKILYSGLFDKMNKLNEHFHMIKMKNEFNETYYKSLIEHASAGLIVINEQNKIELINRAACNYAGISPDSTNHNLLKIKHPEFFEAICTLKPGENLTYRNILSNDKQILSFRATFIKKENTVLKLVSVQNIRSELDARELESYRKLISVMTHEIMNLLTPLTTVAKELFSLYNREDSRSELAKIDKEIVKTTRNGLLLIDEQGTGIINFVNSYRKISRLPQPEFTIFSSIEWAEQLKIAFSAKMAEYNINFSVESDKTLNEIYADKKLLNQVMINIINNAVDAVAELKENRQIEIIMIKSVFNRKVIKITNNGPLIMPELQERIFIPFYTTKKGGSGIGLSISQEIMKLHNGSISVVSAENKQTSFIIEF